jgi:hypothetical protein
MTHEESCFKLLKVLPLSAQYIYSLLIFVVNNRNLFLDNADFYSINTRNSYNLHLPLCHITKCQKGVQYAKISVFNQLPTSIKGVANETEVFKKTLTLKQLPGVKYGPSLRFFL